MVVTAEKAIAMYIRLSKSLNEYSPRSLISLFKMVQNNRMNPSTVQKKIKVLFAKF